MWNFLFMMIDVYDGRLIEYATKTPQFSAGSSYNSEHAELN